MREENNNIENRINRDKGLIKLINPGETNQEKKKHN